jgi:hypothetical protein
VGEVAGSSSLQLRANTSGDRQDMEDPMQQNPFYRTLTIISFGLLVSALVPAAQAATCSAATVKGDWALTLSGSLLLPTGPVPVAAVVKATLNLDGTVKGGEARNVGGQYADETLSGTFTVNADCTGSATVNFFEDEQLVRTSTLTMIFDDNSKEVRMVQKSLVVPKDTTLPVTILIEGRKQ